jgi:LmbE family N-acetylglucosaminyl deacetylase
MHLTNPNTDVFVPDGIAMDDALARTTHLAIGAHQDDLEFMALHGILECFGRADRWFTGVTMTDGSGSARSGPYADYSNEDMSETRVAEQRRAAEVGGYGCQIQLMLPSAAVKDARQLGPVEDLAAILEVTRPQVVYLHNPADKHDTHVACLLRSIDALRTVPPDRRPVTVYGCELWRDLDWLVDSDKRPLPVDDRPDLGEALASVFESQITGGKRYDLAIQGRRRAHATFLESHEVDAHDLLTFAIDLTPLVVDPALDVTEYTLGFLRRTEADVRDRIARMSRPKGSST